MILAQKVTTEILVNKIIVKYFEKQLEKNQKTDGTDWVIFRRKNAKRMWKAAKHKCFYCERPVQFHASTIDHKFPIVRGGALLDINNLVTSCEWCNKDKGMLTHEEYFYKQLNNAAKGIRPQ